MVSQDNYGFGRAEDMSSSSLLGSNSNAGEVTRANAPTALRRVGKAFVPRNRVEFNQKVLCIMTKLGVIPCAFEQGGRQISEEKSSARFTAWKALLMISLLYSLYINIRLILAFLVASQYEGHLSLGIHIARALLSATFTFWAYKLFIVDRHGMVLLYNFVQTNPVLDSGRLKGRNGKSNMQDMLLTLIPFMVYSLCPFMAGLFLLNPCVKQFGFSLLPPEYREGSAVKILAAACEFYIVMMWMAMAHFGAYHALTCLKVVEKMLMSAAEEIRLLGRCRLETQTASVAKSLLTMSIFNCSTSGVTCSHKILCLLACVFDMYFFIRLVFIEPVVSLMFFIIMFNCIVFYSVMWGYVHMIPETILDFKQQLALKATTVGRNSEYFKRVGKSMRCVGVKVGSIRDMERLSTLLFVEFVSCSVANMLISF